MPHLDAAYNFARWLVGNPADAEDVVQDAYLRAFRYFESFHGGDFRVWLLGIVRNSFLTWVKANRSRRLVFQAETPEDDVPETAWGMPPPDPEALMLRQIDGETLARLFQSLPADYREVLLLRELEDLPYKAIADITGVPPGTVMSRLSRARSALRTLWLRETAQEAAGEV